MITLEETWVICGDATHSDAPEDALRLSVGAAKSAINVDIGGVDRALTGRLPGRFADLIRIAAFVLGADGSKRRGQTDDTDNGEKWHRDFRLVIDVEDVQFWQQTEVRAALEETLGFLSQDSFQFEFVPMPKQAKAIAQLQFSAADGKPFLSWEHINEVCLFSGGLDSLAGAADLILNKRSRVMLVSHLSATKTTNTQNTLIAGLRRLAAEHGCPSLEHVSLKVQRSENLPRTEHTQRTRSFLYAAIAGAIADAIRLDCIRMFENGVVAINLPITGAVVGARATRTAHPQTLRQFGKILSLVAGRKLTVTNPFVLKTRPEIIEALAATPALELAKDSVSCAHVHQRSQEHPHCGVCSQCIDRQFGFRGAGLQHADLVNGYAHNLVDSTWNDDKQRALLLGWIAAADKHAGFRNSGEFLGSFGEVAQAVPPIMEQFGIGFDEAYQAVFDLHKRHGKSVEKVLAQLHQDNARAIRKGELHGDSLLMLLFRQGAKNGSPSANIKATASENYFLKEGATRRIRFRGGSQFSIRETKGLHYLGLLMANPGEMRSATGLMALLEGRAEDPVDAIDERGKDEIRDRISELKTARKLAQECGDEADARRRQAQIDALKRLLSRPDSTPAQRKLSGLVEKDVLDAIKAIGEENPALGAHLKKHVQVGPLLYYFERGERWRVVQAPVPAGDDSDWVGASTLVNRELPFIRDTAQVGRFCEHQNVPTRPGKTKAGREHKQRRLVHQPSFDEAMRRYARSERDLQNAADQALTEKLQRQSSK